MRYSFPHAAGRSSSVNPLIPDELFVRCSVVFYSTKPGNLLPGHRDPVPGFSQVMPQALRRREWEFIFFFSPVDAFILTHLNSKRDHRSQVLSKSFSLHFKSCQKHKAKFLQFPTRKPSIRSPVSRTQAQGRVFVAPCSFFPLPCVYPSLDVASNTS